jgi:hypothetical protein
MLDRAFRPLAYYKMGFHFAVLKGFKEPHTENCAGCTGQANDQASHLSLFLARIYLSRALKIIAS